jgi:hypothetical protein
VASVALISGGAMFSPGPLSAVAGDALPLGGVKSHAELRDCMACHAAPWDIATMADRCLTCHTDIQAQLRDPQSLHGALPDPSGARACRACHTEHKGAQASLTSLDERSFPHDRLGFSLAAHRTKKSGQPFACADCHAKRLSQFDLAQCETCHRTYQADFVVSHISDFGKDCLSCHDGVDRFAKARFDHNAFAFALVGKHIGVKCSQCHANARTLADLKGAPQACAGCHTKDDAHKGAFGTNCAQCHTPEDWKKATFDHNLAAFKLTGKHANVACDKCHVNNVFKGTPQACAGCHSKDDAHKGVFGTDCAKCHTPEDWKQATFDHNLPVFKLTGAHVKVACDKCHVNNVFKGTPQTCAACHPEPDVHKGAFGTDCAQCHTTTTWQGATFNHAFPLNHGRQGTQPCARCHTPPNYRAYTCYNCHEHDPARIASRHRGEGIAQFDDCVRCHPTGRGGD